MKKERQDRIAKTLTFSPHGGTLSLKGVCTLCVLVKGG